MRVLANTSQRLWRALAFSLSARGSHGGCGAKVLCEGPSTGLHTLRTSICSIFTTTGEEISEQRG